jgi:hypothetical protein
MGSRTSRRSCKRTRPRCRARRVRRWSRRTCSSRTSSSASPSSLTLRSLARASARSASRSASVLTRPRSLLTVVRTGYVCQPPACCAYQSRRAACSRGAKHVTYAVRLAPCAVAPPSPPPPSPPLSPLPSPQVTEQAGRALGDGRLDPGRLGAQMERVGGTVIKDPTQILALALALA